MGLTQSASFCDQTVWVVGASSGIGRALASELVRRGARVIVSARSIDKLDALVAGLNSDGKVRAMALPFDASDLDLAPSMSVKAEKAFEGYTLDAVFLCQGISNRGRVAETDISVEKRLFDVNFFSSVALAKAVLPGFLERGSGRFVVISSVQGLFALPERAPYSASKHALHSYFDALRSEVAHKGISVNIISPGYVRTSLSLNALTTSAGASYNKMDATTAGGYEPENFASRALDRVLSGYEHSVIAQFSAVVAYWLKSLCPQVLSWVMKRRGAKLAKQ